MVQEYHTEVTMPKSTFYNLEESKQDKIIRESIKEFAHKGFDKGNMEGIAKNSRVAKGSMYQYFDGKRDLYMYSVEKALDISLRGIQYVFDDLRQENLFDIMYRGFAAAWPLLEKERDVFLLLRNINYDADPAMKKSVIDRVNRSSEEMFLKIIEDNKARGLIREDIDSRIILLYIDGISVKFKSCMLERAMNKGQDILDTDFADNEKLIAGMIDLMRNGIALQPVRSESNGTIL